MSSWSHSPCIHIVGTLRAALGDEFVERLSLPECVVGWMIHRLLRPGQAVEAMRACVVAGGTGAAKRFVVVVGAALNWLP